MFNPTIETCPRCGQKTLEVFDTDMWYDEKCTNSNCKYYNFVDFEKEE